MPEYPPYPSTTEAIEEYKSLRAEILESQKQRVTLLQVSLAAVVGLFTYFMQDKRVESFEALLLATVATAACLFTYSTRLRERRLSNFIATFLGPMSPWSSMSSSEGRLKFFQRSSTAMALVLCVLNAAVIKLSFPGWPTPESTFDYLWATAAGLSVAQIFVLWKTTRLPDFKPAFERTRQRMMALRSIPSGSLLEAKDAPASDVVQPKPEQGT